MVSYGLALSIRNFCGYVKIAPEQYLLSEQRQFLFILTPEINYNKNQIPYVSHLREGKTASNKGFVKIMVDIQENSAVNGLKIFKYHF